MFKTFKHEKRLDYYSLLQDILIDYNLLDKPGNIFNVDESGLQLNNRPGYVLAATGSKSVSAIISSEKGETMFIVACDICGRKRKK